jgi:hypothetical protein
VNPHPRSDWLNPNRPVLTQRTAEGAYPTKILVCSRGFARLTAAISGCSVTSGSRSRMELREGPVTAIRSGGTQLARLVESFHTCQYAMCHSRREVHTTIGLRCLGDYERRRISHPRDRASRNRTVRQLRLVWAMPARLARCRSPLDERLRLGRSLPAAPHCSYRGWE